MGFFGWVYIWVFLVVSNFQCIKCGLYIIVVIISIVLIVYIGFEVYVFVGNIVIVVIYVYGFGYSGFVFVKNFYGECIVLNVNFVVKYFIQCNVVRGFRG